MSRRYVLFILLLLIIVLPFYFLIRVNKIIYKSKKIVPLEKSTASDNTPMAMEDKISHKGEKRYDVFKTRPDSGEVKLEFKNKISSDEMLM